MNMVTENYVSFETAKLLEEKGYKGDFDGYYNNAGCKISRPNPNLKNYNYYKSPSLYCAMKWLREVHGLHIDVFVGIDESHDADGVMVDEWHFWTYHITTTNGEIVYDAYDQFDVVEHQTYEEAAENAILFCLNNLI